MSSRVSCKGRPLASELRARTASALSSTGAGAGAGALSVSVSACLRFVGEAGEEGAGAWAGGARFPLGTAMAARSEMGNALGVVVEACAEGPLSLLNTTGQRERGVQRSKCLLTRMQHSETGVRGAESLGDGYEWVPPFDECSLPGTQGCAAEERERGAPRNPCLPLRETRSRDRARQ